MRRRDFIVGLGSAAALPLRAHAQGKVRRIGILMPLSSDDLEGQRRLKAFVEGLQQLGWDDGRNMQLDTRWIGAGSADSIRKYAAELTSLAPDVVLTSGGSMPVLHSMTRSIPIVFVNVADPVGGGFVESLPRPGGNATGFMQFEYSLSGKWLELLKEITPRLARAAVVRNPNIPSGTGQFAAIQSIASSSKIELRPVNVQDRGEVERVIAAFAQQPNGGLIVTASAAAAVHRGLIIRLAAQHKLPAVYPWRTYVADGGLISYGIDLADQYRRAASYVDRILRGERPGDLPVQAPNKFDLVVNLKTAKALDLTLPPTVLARADEVIE